MGSCRFIGFRTGRLGLWCGNIEAFASIQGVNMEKEDILV